MTNFWNDFKKFAVKGNAVDLAIGVIIGAAFGAIVTSIVDTIITPLLSLIVPNSSFEELTVEVGTAVFEYGRLIAAIIDFFIIAMVLFFIVRFILKLRKKEDETQPAKSPEDPADIKLLKEIRDELKKK